MKTVRGPLSETVVPEAVPGPFREPLSEAVPGHVGHGGLQPADRGRFLSAVPPRRVGTLPPLAVHQLPHDTDELGGLEGLGEEGVDPGGGFTGGIAAGADDGHRKMPGPRIGPQPLGRPDPVETGHDDVEGDDIGPNPMHDIQTLGTIGRGHDLEPLEFEIDPDQLPDHLVVVDNEHPAGRA